MELSVFPQPAVAAALSNYVEARYHTDDDATKAVQLEMTGTLTQPTFVIVDPVTMEVIRQAPQPLLSVEKALAFLEQD
ncbi:hypothetical protein [Planctomycetes bacterium Pla163]|uniref:hypothetical protein n=1 Tax=Rohdeia mirabilis TaxID=2528008 RepID=UPI00119D4302